ncbi:aprataxin and PNK-like factor isoform X3 [Drosophila teissieri]|uniref:aprataxin and PNK-like factor isoform X3 n=1 Tax=Drosophila teissieri TaxID=7243 RepID=UPI001CBA2DA4|nr:aprataxin and PNK-like factor isoform X3 [Drosophila teissieri]
MHRAPSTTPPYPRAALGLLVASAYDATDSFNARRNPAHRSAEAHPGDQDYRRPDFPAPPLGTPACPYGNSCYRRNPVHFQDYSHPADFNSAQNIRNRLRQRRAQRQNDDDSCTDEEDEPFGGDNDKDADYRPGADIDEDEDDDLEFDSQRISGDDFD